MQAEFIVVSAAEIRVTDASLLPRDSVLMCHMISRRITLHFSRLSKRQINNCVVIVVPCHATFVVVIAITLWISSDSLLPTDLIQLQRVLEGEMGQLLYLLTDQPVKLNDLSIDHISGTHLVLGAFSFPTPMLPPSPRDALRWRLDLESIMAWHLVQLSGGPVSVHLVDLVEASGGALVLLCAFSLRLSCHSELRCEDDPLRRALEESLSLLVLDNVTPPITVHDVVAMPL